MVNAARRVLGWTFAVGGVCFALGFFGPMLLAPSANQGPLLGIFITGPLGLLLGLVIGVVRELTGRSAPGAVVPPGAPSSGISLAGVSGALRPLAAVGGVALAYHGVTGLPRGEGRGAAAAIVISVVLFHYAATGRIPGWARR